MSPPSTPGGYPALSRTESFVLLAAVVIFFLVGMGPVWEHPWDVDRSILYSYVPIPFLVLAVLAVRRKLRLDAWALHTLELVFAKFVITASILVAIWASSRGPERTFAPPARPAPPSASNESPSEVPIVPTEIPPGSTGRISGRVLHPDGRPRAGALVYVASGLEEFVFAPPQEPAAIVNHGEGFTPALSAVQVGQKVRVTSTDRTLHTLVASQPEKGWIFNLPVPGAGEGRPWVFREGKGLLTVHCTVHGERERQAYLGVFAHPFFQITGEDGRFAFEGVPAGEVRIEAFDPLLGRVARGISLGRGQEIGLELAMPRS